jgi:hypothetical protein
VFPGLVVEDKDGYQAVAYARATAVVAEAIKELRQETRTLWTDATSKLDSLMQEINLLRREVREIKSQIGVIFSQ